MGWNSVTVARPCPLFEGIPNESYWYFVHSFYVDPSNKTIAVASTDYGTRLCRVSGGTMWWPVSSILKRVRPSGYG